MTNTNDIDLISKSVTNTNDSDLIKKSITNTNDTELINKPITNKRIFLIVLDSVGIGELPDADKYGDKGSNTILSCSKSKFFDLPNMAELGLFNIEGTGLKPYEGKIIGSYGRLKELSNGKDTTTGHWEIAGLVSEKPMPVFPEGFPEDFLQRFCKKVNRGYLCNKPYSGTEVIKDYGEEHIKTGDLIIYTSADSVLQIAAHEDVIPVNELYSICEIAREMLTDDLAVGRVIARPFIGNYPDFVRTSNRHDFSLKPTGRTVLDELKDNGYCVYSIGKINDIFAGEGITKAVRTTGNTDGINKLFEALHEDFNGLCFVNLVDFDMKYGHRNDVDGYALALKEFDDAIPDILNNIKNDDILIITADHGCDPATESTDHSREYVPLIVYSPGLVPGTELGTIEGFNSIALLINDYFELNVNHNADSVNHNADNVNHNADNVNLNADKVNLNADNMNLNADIVNHNADNMNFNAHNMNLNAHNIPLKFIHTI